MHENLCKRHRYVFRLVEVDVFKACRDPSMRVLVPSAAGSANVQPMLRRVRSSVRVASIMGEEKCSHATLHLPS